MSLPSATAARGCHCDQRSDVRTLLPSPQASTKSPGRTCGFPVQSTTAAPVRTDAPEEEVAGAATAATASAAPAQTRKPSFALRARISAPQLRMRGTGCDAGYGCGYGPAFPRGAVVALLPTRYD